MIRILAATWSRRLAGGAEVYLSRCLTGLARERCALALACEQDAPLTRPLMPLPAGVQTFDLGASSLPAIRAWRPDVVFSHGLLDPAFEDQLLEMAPGVFFGHTYYGTCISGEKTHKLPVVQPCGRSFTAACLALYFPRRCGGLSPVTLVRDYRRQRRRLASLQRYGGIITASEHMRREYERHGAAGGRVHVIPTTDPAAAEPCAPDDAQRHAGRTVRLAFVGRMERLKGGEHLLRALPAVASALSTPIHLTLAGDGPARARWEALAATIGSARRDVTCEFPGWLGAPAVDAVIGASDVLVVPSLWPEPLGLVGGEARRRRVAVVAYASGGIPEWLREGIEGCLAPGNPPTVRGLQEALVRCIRLFAGRPKSPCASGRETGLPAAHVHAVLRVLEQTARAGSTRPAAQGV